MYMPLILLSTYQDWLQRPVLGLPSRNKLANVGRVKLPTLGEKKHAWKKPRPIAHLVLPLWLCLQVRPAHTCSKGGLKSVERQNQMFAKSTCLLGNSLHMSRFWSRQGRRFVELVRIPPGSEWPVEPTGFGKGLATNTWHCRRQTRWNQSGPSGKEVLDGGIESQHESHGQYHGIKMDQRCNDLGPI